MGIAGAAWATSFSQIVAGGLLLRVLKRRGFLRKPSTEAATSTTTTSKLVEEQSESSLSSSSPTTTDTIKQLLAFVPFLFVMSVKIGWHNSCAATAASLGGAQAAAHSALASVAMLCFVLGDVGSSMSQAFLPAFVKKTTTQQTNSEDDDLNKEPKTTNTMTKMTTDFDLDAAMPTIKQLLRCTLGISSTVMVIAAIIIGIFPTNITRDPAVVAEMRKTLPWIVTALSFHGSAVTLEGLLLARKKFRPLSVIYSLLAIGVVGFQLATRQFHLGLGGVWACYVWFCATRVFVFSSIGGLFQPMKFVQRIRNKFVVKACDDPKAASSSIAV